MKKLLLSTNSKVIVTFAIILLSIFLTSIDYAKPESCIKVGVIGEFSEPTSGYTRFFGRDTYDGASIAVQQLNKNSNRCFKLIQIETNNELADIVPLVQMYAKKDVRFFMGLGLSAQANVSIPALAQTHSLLISPTASSDKLKKGNRIISFFPSQRKVAIAIVNYLLKHKINKIDIIYCEDRDYSTEMAKTFEAIFTKAGGTIESIMPVNSNLISLQQYASVLKKLDDGCVFIPMSGLNAAKTILELERLGINNNIIGSDSWATYAGSIKKLINRFVTNRTVRATIPVMYHSDVDTKVNQVFVKQFKVKYDSPPVDMAAFSYDGIRLLGKMLDKCNQAQLRNNPIRCLKKALPFKSTTGTIEGKNGIYLARPIMMEHIVMGKQ